jgi:hypothetical protein
MVMRAILILAALLAGCGTTPIEVKMPVAVGCLGMLPVRPVAQFGVGQYMGERAAAQSALADASAWELYAVRLEAAMAGCDKPDLLRPVRSSPD